MRLVKVKRSTEEKDLGMLVLKLETLNVCEASKEDGNTILDFYQIHKVTEVWNLEEE